MTQAIRRGAVSPSTEAGVGIGVVPSFFSGLFGNSALSNDVDLSLFPTLALFSSPTLFGEATQHQLSGCVDPASFPNGTLPTHPPFPPLPRVQRLHELQGGSRPTWVQARDIVFPHLRFLPVNEALSVEE